MKKIVISVFFPIIILAQSISELGVAPSYIVDSDTLSMAIHMVLVEERKVALILMEI